MTNRRAQLFVAFYSSNQKAWKSKDEETSGKHMETRIAVREEGLWGYLAFGV